MTVVQNAYWTSLPITVQLDKDKHYISPLHTPYRNPQDSAEYKRGHYLGWLKYADGHKDIIGGPYSSESTESIACGTEPGPYTNGTSAGYWLAMRQHNELLNRARQVEKQLSKNK